MSRLFAQSALRGALRDLARQPSTARSFSSITSLRPTLPSSSSTSSIFRPTASPLARLPAVVTETTADVVAQTAITTSPAFCGLQVRFGPRPTMNRPSRLVRMRRHGFLSRVRTANGRKLLARRKAKGRKRLSA